MFIKSLTHLLIASLFAISGILFTEITANTVGYTLLPLDMGLQKQAEITQEDVAR
ncbi:hypothetical protein [Dolichospermum sp. UHCC 0259]|uniref:hypothetical protein n=1 Tax=Dolichospermum sp. UHCC 0259 TaxID=2590010 RepID=UPI001445BD8A|nr:hypothetical protein [Dolichospermum sp. UHCC 0259]